MFSNHVTKNISAYCHGELSSEESRQFAEHLIACAKCRAKFEEIKLGIRLAEQLPQVPAPDYLWTELQDLIEKKKQTTGQPVRSFRLGRAGGTPALRQLAIAASLLLLVGLGVWTIYHQESPTPTGPSWQVQRLNGTPTIGSKGIGNQAQLGVGQWLETDDTSRAEIAVSSIGKVDIDANTRVRLLETQPTEHRLELARGKMSARIWAPPRLFFVDTPSAVAADLGCAYTLEVDDAGSSLLRVTSGWVALELKDRESIVPAGAVCETKPGIGPGTPYFEDCAPDFKQAIETVDFDSDPESRAIALDHMLSQARARDTLTLWHLLSRVEGEDRARVFDRIASYAPPPTGVTREGILQLDPKMLELWRYELQPKWIDRTIIPTKVADYWWQFKNGVDRRVRKLKQ
jgi:hypothetical protein